MTNLVVAKFGGSAIGRNGETIPKIIQRILDLRVDSKVIAVFSAPLTVTGTFFIGWPPNVGLVIGKRCPGYGSSPDTML